jgi:hypothetical protein
LRVQIGLVLGEIEIHVHSGIVGMCVGAGGQGAVIFEGAQIMQIVLPQNAVENLGYFLGDLRQK